MPRLFRNLLFLSCCGGTTAGELPKLPTRRVAAVNSPRRLSLSGIGSATPPLSPKDLSLKLAGSHLHVFTLEELKAVTRGFSASNFIGQGGFGPVYKGFVDENLRPGLEAQRVAVKLLDLEGPQGHREWLAEVILLGQLRHPNLVKLIGYCYQKEHRLLVYEHMSNGSLENYLFKNVLAPVPWLKRLKIAVGAAKGLAFLHGADEPVIYRDFKASNILLDMDYEAKLSDFGLAKDGPEGDNTHVTTRIMGTSGYTAPEYVMTGHLTTKSDVYSFGVVLLELLTGRRSLDKTRPSREQDLVGWARPYLRSPEKLYRVMDPSLEGQYSIIGAQKAAELTYRCLSIRPKERPNMRSIIETLEPLMGLKDIPMGFFVYTVRAEKVGDEAKEKREKENGIGGEETDGRRHYYGNRHKRRLSHTAIRLNADKQLQRLHQQEAR